ncbi:aromatic ring-opening dioxygenase LigA [Nocardioides sp. GY 10127]|uniref:aromatic ring-opening dioxygenase LigA n=1 Tax=Nocardioides sp. GY 10127 TaxID=2569762 RepID=UPI0010A769B6|nr:aromatic ring-opening dioxygenase LigA [Nocardioides sp. GY 10127]TIC85735.1 aromatic ring-opening dioxygenase LigA [Nocardioides sp. GY 10127]
MRKAAWISSVALGVVLVIGGVVTWAVVTSTLSAQRITVSGDADCMAGTAVDNPISAYCQAKVIDKHTAAITGGQTYAELAQDDPLRETAMTSSFLQASLFTSVLAFGMSAVAVAMGLIFVLIGLGMRDVTKHSPQHAEPAHVAV